MTSKQSSILLVEDEQFIARAYQVGLEKEGHEVDVASNGEEALLALADKPYDLILLDLMLPRVNGFEVMRRRHENGQNKETPVIILSNLGQEHDMIEAKKLGAVAYMVKADHSIKDVIEKVASILA